MRLTVGTPQARAARRLTLSATEFRLLCRRVDLGVPPGFAGCDPATGDATPRTGAGAVDPRPGELGDDESLRAVARDLSARGVLVADEGADPLTWPPVPAVLADLAALGAPRATVRVDVTMAAGGLRALLAIADGPLATGLVTLADDAVELSMFPAVTLARELARVVPSVPRTAGDGTADLLRGRSGRPEPVTGRVSLAALRAYHPGLAGSREMSVEDTPGPAGPAERALVARLATGTRGMLRALVVGPDNGGVAVGQVVWLATVAGWVGLLPDPDGPRDLVVLRPVEPPDLGRWVAPALARILEASVERP